MSNKRLFEDLSELAGGAVGVIASLRQQLRDETRDRMDSFAGRMDLVTRDEFQRLEGMITKARTTQETLLKRIEAIEAKLGLKTAASPAAASSKPSTSKAKPAKKPAAKAKKPTSKKK